MKMQLKSKKVVSKESEKPLTLESGEIPRTSPQTDMQIDSKPPVPEEA